MSSILTDFQSAFAALSAQVGGDLALDLANTIDFRGTAKAVDHIASLEGVLAWSVKAGVIDLDAAELFGLEASKNQSVTDRLVTDISHLRDAIFHVGSAVADGTEPPEEHLKILHNCAHAALGAARLHPGAGRKATINFEGGDCYAAIIGPVAWAALQLFTSDRIDRLKQCPPDDCRWLFLDQTKNKSRRWCEMATCGNRAKARKHRKVK